MANIILSSASTRGVFQRLSAVAIAMALLVGCAAGPTNRLVRYPETDVLFMAPADVDRLCKLAPGARQDRTFRGCYFPAQRLAIVPHDDADALAHELRHAREGAFHE